MMQAKGTLAEPIPLFHVVKPGLMTTIQDLGRPGYERFGVSTGGAMDAYSLRVANILAGNAPSAAAIEVMLMGPELVAAADLVVAIAGADLGAAVEGEPFLPGRATTLRAGQTLAFGKRRGPGALAYVAVTGGIDVPTVLGSRATFSRAGFGGLDGRPLSKGDVIHGPGTDTDGPLTGWSAAPSEWISASRPIRFLPGPHADAFAGDASAELAAAAYTVSAVSDRMGYRLLGPPLARVSTDDMTSEAAPLGAIQSPAGSAPIVLMADRQTTGGYPIGGVVISADIPALAQRAPGDVVRFAAVSLEEAQAAWREMLAELRMIEAGVGLRRAIGRR